MKTDLEKCKFQKNQSTHRNYINPYKSRIEIRVRKEDKEFLKEKGFNVSKLFRELIAELRQEVLKR